MSQNLFVRAKKVLVCLICLQIEIIFSAFLMLQIEYCSWGCLSLKLAVANAALTMAWTTKNTNHKLIGTKAKWS